MAPLEGSLRLEVDHMRSIFGHCFALAVQPSRAPKVSAAVSHGIYNDFQSNRWGWGHNLFGEFGGGGTCTPTKCAGRCSCWCLETLD